MLKGFSVRENDISFCSLVCSTKMFVLYSRLAWLNFSWMFIFPYLKLQKFPFFSIVLNTQTLSRSNKPKKLSAPNIIPFNFKNKLKHVFYLLETLFLFKIVDKERVAYVITVVHILHDDDSPKGKISIS